MKKAVFSLLCISLGLHVHAQNTGKDIYRPEQEQINNLIDTKLDIKLNFDNQSIDGKEWLTLKPHFYPTDSLTLDAKNMLIHQISLVNNNGNTAPLQYDYDLNHQKLKIKLNKTYTRDQTYKIFIQYTAYPEGVPGRDKKYYSKDKGLYFINPQGKNSYIPTQAWTQGEPMDNSGWFPTIDSPNQKTTQEISLTVPKNFVTLSNGTLTSKIDNANGTRTDNWRQTQKHAPYLFFIGVGDFAVVEDQWKGRPVNYYVEPEYKSVAKEIFGKTPEMLTFFSEKFGYEYPWDKYSQMVVRDFVTGAMENTTAVSHSQTAQQKHGELVDKNVWEDVIAHELAHHWFGDLVTSESFANLTVNESFANYSEYLWREHKYGKDYADELREEDLEDYFSGNNFHKDLVRFDYKKVGDMFDRVTYNKGGYILHMLRSYLGDDAFFESIKYFLNHYEYQKAEAQQLRLAFEHITGKDLNWFFNQWFFGYGHPKINVVTEYKPSEVVVNLKQTQSPLFEFPLTIDVYENGKRTRHKVWVKKEPLNTFKFNTQGKAQLVVVDGINDIVAEFNEEKPVDLYVQQYLLCNDELPSRMQAIKKLAYNQLISKNALSTLITAMKDPSAGIRKLAIESLDVTDSVVQEQAEEALAKIAESDPKTLVRAEALKKLAQIDKDKKYLNLFKNALKSESFAVKGAAIDYLSQNAPEELDNLSEDLDIKLAVNSPRLLEKLIPQWRQENKINYFPELNEMAALYALMPYIKPEYAKASQMAFDWILSTNDLASTQAIAKVYSKYYKFMKENQKEAIPFLRAMANNALELKQKTYQQYPNDDLKKQIEVLEEVINEIKD
ncbi:M1 family aminopeptidase [Ornithobacterium rhinotracheale]